MWFGWGVWRAVGGGAMRELCGGGGAAVSGRWRAGEGGAGGARVRGSPLVSCQCLAGVLPVSLTGSRRCSAGLSCGRC